MLKLDVKDRKILYQLDLNARQSYSQIAKKVRLSKEVVQYRVKKLQDRGLIKYFMTVIDSNKLGYILFRCFVKCQNLDLKKEKEIIDFLKPRVGWVVNIRGKWDFNIAVWKKDIHEFMIFWHEFYTKFSDVIIDYTSNPIPKMWLYRRGWLLHKEKDTSEYDIWGGQSQKNDIDEIDRKILSLIVANARMPSIEMAKKLHVTEGTIRQRLKKLEKNKVILRYVAFLDTAKFGMHYIKLHFHTKNINEKKLRVIREFAHLHPNILYGNDSVGGHFLEFDLNVESHEKLYKIIDQFREQFADVIRDYEFVEYVKEHKFEYIPKD
tara:strand:- start:283 stop:1248 length:966 start_codon:yes stop_codon:yes gene_type:complete